jgi:hypothetical protein
MYHQEGKVKDLRIREKGRTYLIRTTKQIQNALKCNIR